MSQMNGVVVGIVRAIDKDRGRVRVYFPWLSEENQTYWARIATLMAGSMRGSYFMPEVGDEVLVAFEHGDSQTPYVIGFLWNGQDKPPSNDIDASVRRIKTVSGHTLDFDDRPGQEEVTLTTQGGHTINLDDSPSTIKVTTKGGHEIQMDDFGGLITIRTKLGNQIQISDTPPGITISTQAGQLMINCLQANVTAGALLNITAPFTAFSGVVQVPVLIAQAVVGSAYTPAPGNTFGL